MNTTKLFFSYLLLSASIIIFFSPKKASAQFFKGGLVAGANFTQIDGDCTAGYGKVGINAGFMAEIPFGKNWAFGLELLYAQKGSRVLDSNDDFSIIMDYADIPLMVRYRDPIGKMTFGAGVSINRLVNARFINNGLDSSDLMFGEDDDFNKFDFSGLVELTYMFSDVWGINGRYNYSIVPIRRDIACLGLLPTQYHNIVTIRTVFLFSGLFKK